VVSTIADQVPRLRISTDPRELDIEMIHRYLAQDSYWARGIGRAVLDKAIAHSLCLGGYIEDRQVAFARVITDRATFANLKDVFVQSEFRGRGYGVAIVKAVMDHPDLQRVLFTLGTADAHALYTRFGFRSVPDPQRSMLRPGTFLNPVESPGA
jgi:GNAT superfamily N-acetyltransferase